MLDEKLLEVINRKSDNFLIIGPPGSGKTHILLEITRHLITTRKINPRKLLILCFNRRWSRSIREKTASLIGGSIFEIPVETFYSYCIDFINKARTLLFSKNLYGKKTKKDTNPGCMFGDIKVLNSTEQWSMLKRIIGTLDRKNYPCTFKYMNGSSYIANSFVQEVFDFILRAQENLFKPGMLSGKFTPFSNPVFSELTGIYSRYVKELKKKRLYNYGMLLEETVDILKNHRDIRDCYRMNYDYILVDELHEVNKAQLEIINNISSSNCIFFGNDDQSIYNFRGSMSDSFKKIYIELEPENVMFLNKNYRSGRMINHICRNFIKLSKDRIPKEIDLPHDNQNPDDKVCLKECNTLLEEVNFICREIKLLHLQKKVNFEEMAIIIKGLGYETHLIESALIQNNIPFARRGTRSLLDNRIVKYIINFMRLALIINEIKDSKKIYPDNGESGLKFDILVENILLSEFINLEPLYFKRLKLLHWCSNSNGNGYKNLWSCLVDICEKQKRNTGAEEKELDKIVNFVSAAYELAATAEINVLEFSLALIRDSRVGFMNYLVSEKNYGINTGDQWDSLGDFLKNIEDFSQKNYHNDIKSYIEFIDSIVENQFTEEIEESIKDTIRIGAVNVLSFHQCKGLEFKAVFIPFINRHYLPAKFIFPQAFDIQIFDYLHSKRKLNAEELKLNHLESEIRLFYNGITRASEYLYITSNHSRKKSLFFKELENIHKNLNSSCKTIGTGRRDKTITEEKILVTDLKLDLDLNNLWLVRKRALVATAKMLHKLKYNSVSYLNHIIILKHFYHPHTWWDSVKPTRNSNNPFLLFPASFSYSSLNSFKDCPFKYKIRYYFNLEGEKNLGLILGRIYHEISSNFFGSQDKIFSWEILKKILDQVFGRYHFEFNFLKNEFKEKALLDFRSFFENHMPPHPESSRVEEEFSFKLNQENITGRIDQVNILGDNSIELVDYKSGLCSYSDSDLREELQLKTYRMALDSSRDFEYLKNMNVKMRYVCLENPKKTLYEVHEEYYDFNEVKDILSNIILRIKKEEFEPEPMNYSSCLNCDFKILCQRYYG